MSILICKNTETEGPGTIEDYLRERSIPYTIVELSKGEEIPGAGGYDTLIMMGGPMSVNEYDQYPYIQKEVELVRDFLAADKPILGICLGSQIMAKALGAEVYTGPQKEIGWLDIELTVDGVMDHRFRKLATHPHAGDVWKRFKVFHWHSETFDLPVGTVRLASSGLYRNQAFRFGSKAYAFQFHVEVTRDMVLDWLKDEPVEQERLKLATERYHEVCCGRAWNFYELFFRGNGGAGSKPGAGVSDRSIYPNDV